MATLVRRAPSGDFIEIETDVLPLSATLWVDPDTTIDPADQTGSIGAPYSTVQQAHDALPDNGGTILVCFSADEVSAGDLVATKSVGLQGLGQGADMGTITTTASLLLNNIAAGNITLADVDVRLIEARATDIAAGTGSVNLFDSIVSGSVTAGQLVTRDSALTGGVHVIGLLVESSNSQISQLTVSAGDIDSEDDTWIAAVSASGDVTAQGSTFQQGVTFGTLDAKMCTLTGEPDTEAIDGGAAVLDNCTIGVPIDSTGSVTLKDCRFAAEVNIDITSVGGRCLNTQLTGDWDAGAELQIDSFSYYAAVDAGHAVTSLNTTIIDRPLSITLEIAVPAVAAAAVGYVNTTLVGTELENIFAVGDPVLVCPQADLVAAGAGGGYVNARISAANTLRTAFLGALAGGNANFTVARGR